MMKTFGVGGAGFNAQKVGRGNGQIVFRGSFHQALGGLAVAGGRRAGNIVAWDAVAPGPGIVGWFGGAA